MQFIEGEVYHIYNRGNNGQRIFFKEENYIFFLKKMRKELPAHCEILAYCLMPNHFHLMALVKKSDSSDLQSNKTKSSLQSAVGVLLRSYTRAIQNQENFQGSLFQQKTKAQLLNKSSGNGLNHPAICMHYIHQNPKRAGLTTNLEEWQYSSFNDYANLGLGTLCNKATGFSITGIKPENFLSESYDVISYAEE